MKRVAEESNVGNTVTLDPRHPQMNFQPQNRQHFWELPRAGHNYHVWLTSLLINSTSWIWKNYKPHNWTCSMNLQPVCPEEQLWSQLVFSSDTSSLTPQRLLPCLSGLIFRVSFHLTSLHFAYFVSFPPSFATAILLFLSLLFNLPLW